MILSGARALGDGIVDIGKSAISAYGDFEQLKGGIETLFGTGGAATVEEYADSVGKSVSEVQDEFNMLMEAQTLAMDNAGRAYETAGLSANEYMETVTSFAASLKSSTENEVEAAKAANQAVIDMADNANKMGTNMESIQNAYQGFSKQNYTMLDNLKLGYGGTKEEMQRLLEDAQKLSGQKYDISNLNDVYSAIHVIQDELGITGTTAEEASTTIQGSINAVKASWENLVTGMADGDADFDTLISNFVESVSTAADNLIPRIEVAIGGIENLIDEMMPVVMDKIPEIINSVLPKLLQAGVNLVNTLVEGIGQNSGELIQGASQIISQLADAFIALLPELITLGIQVITQIMLGMAEGAPGLIPTITDTVVTIVGALSENLPMLIDAGVQLIEALAQGIVDNLPQLMETASEIATTILDGIGDLCPALTPVTDAIQLLIDNFDDLISIVESTIIAFDGLKAGMAIQSVVQGFQEAKVTLALFEMQTKGVTIAQAALNGTLSIGEAVVALLTGKMSLAELATAGLAKAHSMLNAVMAANPIALIVTLIAALVAAFLYLWNTNEGFRQFWIDLWANIKETAANVIDAIIVFFTETIPNAIDGLIEFVQNNWKSLLMLLNPVTFLAGIFTLVYNNCDGFRSFVDGFVQKVKAAFVNAWNSVVAFFTETLPSLPAKFMYWLSYLLTSIVLWGADLISWAAANIPLFAAKIVTCVSELPGKIASFLGDILIKVAGWGVSMVTKASDAGKGFLKSVGDHIKKLPASFALWLGNVISKVATFIIDMKDKAKEAGKEFFDNIVDAIKDLPDKLTEIAKNAVDGAINAIKNKAAEMAKAVKGMVKGATDGAADAAEAHAQATSRSNSKGSSGKGVAGYSQQPVSSYSTMSKGRNINAGTARMTYEGASASGNYGYSMNMDYRKMKQMFTESMQEMNLVVQLDNRQMGRVIRGYS